MSCEGFFLFYFVFFFTLMDNQFGFKEEFQGNLKKHCYHDHVLGSSLKFNFCLAVIAGREQERGSERGKERDK